MSSGIGFAGLGKYLNDKGLSLLKGRKHSEYSKKLTDKRDSPNNTTDYQYIKTYKDSLNTKRKWVSRLIYISILAIIIILYFLERQNVANIA